MPIPLPALFVENNEKRLIPHKKFSSNRLLKVALRCLFQLHQIMEALLGGQEDGFSSSRPLALELAEDTA
jgi:hypothetical protein